MPAAPCSASFSSYSESGTLDNDDKDDDRLRRRAARIDVVDVHGISTLDPRCKTAIPWNCGRFEDRPKESPDRLRDWTSACAATSFIWESNASSPSAPSCWASAGLGSRDSSIDTSLSSDGSALMAGSADVARGPDARFRRISWRSVK